MKAQELREKFLDFFKSKGHTIIPSASLVPQNDPTVLFTTAGMHPLVPYLLGEKHPGGSRVANVQKCMRTTDIDDVGDNRHLTFFEMLGNWSFGDYFKKDAIAWSFEFLTGADWLKINPENLYVSIFSGDADVPRDDEAIAAWKKAFASHAQYPIKAEFSENIYALAEYGQAGGSSGNGGGNKGDDSDSGGKPGSRSANKIFPYGRDKNWWQAGDKGPSGSDTEMFVDIEGDLPADMRVKHRVWQEQTKSSAKCHINCDCGRFIEIWNNVFMEYNGLGEGKYKPLIQKNVDTGMGLERVLAFLNGQSSVFDADLFKDALGIILGRVEGGIISGEQEIKAKIIVDHLRAAVFLVSDGVAPSNKDRGYVLRKILRRAIVLGKGMGLGFDWLEKIVSGYIESYARAYPELVQNRRAILNAILEEEKKFSATLEQGLREFERRAKTGLISAKDAFDLFQSFGIPWEITSELARGRGLSINEKEFEEEFVKHRELSRSHGAEKGVFKGGLADHSENTVSLHTATHLLQAALRRVLGEHVVQKGSNVNAERARFDFPHPQKVNARQIQEVEDLINQWVDMDLKVIREVMGRDEAFAKGALGQFGEKYGDTVSVYTILDPAGQVISREFCGGPHVEHTKQIGHVKIVKEEAVSAGLRRIRLQLRVQPNTPT